MGLGAMMAGGNPAEGREVDDYYPTPPEVTRALLRDFNFGKRIILEPTGGDYRMAAEIEGAGYSVIASDINPRDPRVWARDFFEIRETPATALITNPPFNLAKRFVEHGMGVLKMEVMALLLKSTFWHASTRSKLFEKHPPAVINALTWRPDFKNQGAPTMDCSWFIWKHDYKGPTQYRLMHK